MVVERLFEQMTFKLRPEEAWVIKWWDLGGEGIPSIGSSANQSQQVEKHLVNTWRSKLTEILPLALTKEQGSMNTKELARRNVFLLLGNSANSLTNSSDLLAKKMDFWRACKLVQSSCEIIWLHTIKTNTFSTLRPSTSTLEQQSSEFFASVPTKVFL